MTGGLRYLHERPVPIIHKDLASKNILLSLNGTPKIADLGIIDIINSTNDYPNDENAQPLTNVYTEPEAFLQGAVCDYSTDIYSLGVIILEVSIGRDPTAIEAFRVTSSNDVQLVPELERRSIDLQDVSNSPLHCLIVACLTRKEDRPDALSLYEKLKELQSELLYVNSPDVPLMETSSTKRNELEDKLLLLKAEKESLKSQLNEHHGKNDFSSDVRRLEATIRSRDSEIAALRSRNISLEEKLDDCQRSKESLSSCNQMPSVRLTARGSPSNESITADNSTAIELKQLKKQLEKYKDLTIELDSKLKDAQSELSKYSTRQTSMDIQAQYDINALRAENRLLRSDLERSRRDALHYHSAYSRGFNTSRY
jgi:serine/threonine protein kinase